MSKAKRVRQRNTRAAFFIGATRKEYRDLLEQGYLKFVARTPYPWRIK